MWVVSGLLGACGTAMVVVSPRRNVPRGGQLQQRAADLFVVGVLAIEVAG
jgi:hypothetical protein